MAVKTKQIKFTGSAIAVKATKSGAYRTINGYQGVTLGIPNNALITDISTVKTNDYFSIEDSGNWSAQLRITDDAKNISSQLNVPYWIHSHSYGNVKSSAPKATLDFINQYSAHFDTQLFYFYLQGYVSNKESLSIACQTQTAMIISYVEPAPVIRAELIDRTGFYSIDNPVWDKKNSRADIYIEAETYNDTTIASYNYEYWYGIRTDDNVNSGEIKDPTSTLVLSNLPVSSSEGDLSYKIYAKDSLGQQSNVVEGTIVGIDYTIPNKIVKFEIQRSSTMKPFDPDDAGEYLYATIQLQGDDLALYYAEGKIKISFTINQESQDFLLASTKLLNPDGSKRDDKYYQSLPDINEIIGENYTFSLTRNDSSIFKGSNTNDISISVAISFGLQTGTEIEWVPISNLTATRTVNATPSILSIEREGIAFGCELKKPATSGDEENVYSLNDPKFLCDMRAYFKKKVFFDERLSFKKGIEGDAIYLTGKGLIYPDTDSYIDVIKDGQTNREYGWEPITLNSAFVVWNETTDSCQSKRKLDNVSIIGAIKPSAQIGAGSTTVIATLDKKYAPPHRLQFRACLESTTIEGRIVVAPQYESDGTTVSGTTLSFVNRGAVANTNLWISICINYMV